MTITKKINKRTMKALNNLPSFVEMEKEIDMNLNMIHGVALKPLQGLEYRKLLEYKQEVESEMKALFDVDSVEYAIKNQIPF
jgi:DNA-binding transcriptional regulator YhcF (GntR family)